MRQCRDELDLHYTATDTLSLTAFNDILESCLASSNDAMPLLTNLLSQDPDMPMARCFHAYLLKMAADPIFSNPIQQQISQLNEQRNQLNSREILHLEMLTHWAANRNTDAINTGCALLKQYPRDMLALRILHYLHFYAGDATGLNSSMYKAVKIWRPEQRFYGYLLGMHSFGLEESGDYSAAEYFGRKSIDINQQDIWGAHAVAHVMQMQGRYQEGIAWNGALLPQWQNTNNFIFHMYWHKALFHIGAGELDAALGIYDEHLEAPLKDDFYLDICNNASLLWRLEMLKVDTGPRWLKLEQYALARSFDEELVFSTLHYLLPVARLHNTTLIDKALAHFESWAQQSNHQAEVCKQVGIDLARGIVRLSKQDYAAAAKHIKLAEPDMHLIGGSHTQRHLFTQMREYAVQMA